MHLMYFTEQPMSAYPADIGLESGDTALMFSNKYFDPAAGSRLYNEYLEHYSMVDEFGFDGIMLNEHHNAPFCMQAKCNIFAAILAAVTKNAKIVLLGNPLPLAENPVRLAEELSMIDMISKGRLVSGFVRGGGQEQLAAGVNPAFNRERFQEAHDLIVAAWTRQGPFRWEGDALPAPRRQPLGGAAAEAASAGLDPRRHQPRDDRLGGAARLSLYRAEHADRPHEADLGDLRHSARPKPAFQGGPDYHGLLKQIHVAETEEKAIENAAQFSWMQGEFTGLAHPVWSTPSGYGSPDNRRAFVEFASGVSKNPRYRPDARKAARRS